MIKENKKYSILIVEDEVSLRNALSMKFKREGFTTSSAKDGEVGLVVALKEKPDLILLDMVMPKMDGMTMLKRLRLESEWGRSIRVIFLTNLGADDEQRMKEISKDPFLEYLVKSNWSIADLVDKVRSIITRG